MRKIDHQANLVEKKITIDIEEIVAMKLFELNVFVNIGVQNRKQLETKSNKPSLRENSEFNAAVSKLAT